MPTEKRSTTLHRITELWAYCAVDQNDGTEGVMGCRVSDTWVPMIGADKVKIDQLKPFADAISANTHMPYVLKHFKLVETR
jgi:hypothetical protein